MRNTADLKVITAAALQDAAIIVLQSLYTYRKLYFRNTANLSLMMNAALLKDAESIVLKRHPHLLPLHPSPRLKEPSPVPKATVDMILLALMVWL